MGTPVLVDSEWLEAVDAFVRSRMEAPLPAPTDGGSRFYDVRPARTDGSWKKIKLAVDDESEVDVWTAKAHFIVNGVVDKSLVIDVYAPLEYRMTDQPTDLSDGIFVVWRGRWEMMTTPQLMLIGGEGIEITRSGVFNRARTIANTGVTAIRIGDVNYGHGEVNFNANDFVYAAEGVSLKYPDGNISGSDYINVATTDPATRAKKIIWTGFWARDPSQTGARCFGVVVENGAAAKINGTHLELSRPATQYLTYVSGVSLKNGELVVTRNTIEYVVPS